MADGEQSEEDVATLMVLRVMLCAPQQTVEAATQISVVVCLRRWPHFIFIFTRTLFKILCCLEWRFFFLIETLSVSTYIWLTTMFLVLLYNFLTFPWMGWLCLRSFLLPHFKVYWWWTCENNYPMSPHIPLVIWL